MTKFSWAIGRVCFFLCLGLMIHAVIPHASAGEKRLHPPWWSQILRAILECAAIWLWLVPSIFFIAWFMWFGDNWRSSNDWIIQAVAGSIAIVVSLIVAARILRRGETRSFLRIHLWAPLFLLLMFSAMWAYESVHRIEGLSAESAAQTIFDRRTRGMHERVRLVPDRQNQASSRCRTYWIMAEKEPRGHFSICRHEWFGWVFSSASTYGPSEERLKRAKERLNDPVNRHGAILSLRSIMEDYPNTPAETEARKLLESVGESGSDTKKR